MRVSSIKLCSIIIYAAEKKSWGFCLSTTLGMRYFTFKATYMDLSPFDSSEQYIPFFYGLNEFWGIVFGIWHLLIK